MEYSERRFVVAAVDIGPAVDSQWGLWTASGQDRVVTQIGVIGVRGSGLSESRIHDIT